MPPVDRRRLRWRDALILRNARHDRDSRGLRHGACAGARHPSIRNVYVVHINARVVQDARQDTEAERWATVPRPKGSYHHGDLRAALIAAGLELAREGHPDAMSLRKIARSVGVTPNAAYRHFSGRNDLLAAVAAKIQERMAEAMLDKTVTPECTDQTTAAIARLRGVGLGYIDFAIEEPGWFQLAFFTPEGLERPDGRIPPPLTLLQQALGDLIEAGLLTPERLAEAQWSCWATVHGFAELTIHGPLRDHDPAVVRGMAAQAVDDIITGVTNRPLAS